MNDESAISLVFDEKKKIFFFLFGFNIYPKKIWPHHSFIHHEMNVKRRSDVNDDGQFKSNRQSKLI